MLELWVWSQNLLPTVAVDRDYLTGVQRSFRYAGLRAAFEAVWPWLLLLLGLIVLAVLLRIIIRPARYKLMKTGAQTITDPSRIKKLITRSIDLRSVYDLEIMDQNYREIYRGQVLGLKEPGEIEVELPTFTDLTLDFKNKDAHVAFRMEHGGKQEFYQFDSFTRGINTSLSYGRKERVVHLRMPGAIEIGQKRRFLRIEPTGGFKFKVNLLTPLADGDPLPLNGFRRLHKVEIQDLSLGGLQAQITIRSADLRVKPGQRIYAHFNLPRLDDESGELLRELFVQTEVVAIIRQTKGRRVMSSLADDQIAGPHQIRLRYTARGYIDRDKSLVFFRPATSMAFEDLSRWVQAYQRYRLRLERGTNPMPDRVENLYPRHELRVENKYPAQPPSRR